MKRNRFVKNVSPEELQNELFYYQTLRENGIESLDAQEVNGKLSVEFLRDAVTLESRESAEGFRKFGEFVQKIHAIHFPSVMSIDDKGEKHDRSWSEVIDELIESGKVRQKERAGLSEEATARVVDRLQKSAIREFAGSPSLVHCDLHQNNVLFSGDMAIVIDKGSAIASGDPLYDLALLPIVIPGSIYGDEAEDKKFLAAFTAGYGRDFTTGRSRLDDYVLLRCLEGCPNEFEPEIPEIINTILTKQIPH